MLIAQTTTFADVHSSLKASIRNLGADINDESKNRNSPIELDRRLSPALPVSCRRGTSIALREDIDLRTSPRRAAGVGFRMTWGDMAATKYSESHGGPRAPRVRYLREVNSAGGPRPREAGMDSPALLGQSAAFRRVLEQAEQVATTAATVLLLGETGTGKELVATHIHELSARHDRAMVRVNCAAIPATLVESELFGREKGAFTDAVSRQIGRFEVADHSTLFLDEIGELPAEVQVKLLRVLEERQIERLGSPKGIPVDVRIIAATHRDLEERMVAAAFREDLFYRLNVFPIRVPPLRERVEDIPQLVWHFVQQYGKAFAKRIDEISCESLAALQQYAWPGNIRELRNVVERAMIVATGPTLKIALPPERMTPGATASGWLMFRSNTSAACSTAQDGVFGERAERRTASGSGRQRSRPEWPSWD